MSTIATVIGLAAAVCTSTSYCFSRTLLCHTIPESPGFLTLAQRVTRICMLNAVINSVINSVTA